jgi:hypothetical protein
MFIRSTTLSFGEIAEYWSPEIQSSASWEKVFCALQRAWWLGELPGDSSKSPLQLLKAMFTSIRHRDDLGIVFVVKGDREPEPIELPDGSLEIDPRRPIPVPSCNTENWNEAACKDAFDALANTCSLESYPEYTPGFAAIRLTYQEFITWLEKDGIRIPKFWQPSDQRPTPEHRKTWHVKPGKSLTESEQAVYQAIKDAFPDGVINLKAKARDQRIRKQLKFGLTTRTIQRTLEKIVFR